MSSQQFDSTSDMSDRTGAALDASDTATEQNRALVDLTDMASHMSADQSQSLVTDLTESGLLPELAVAYANQNFARLDREGGTITNDDLSHALQSADNPLERALLTELKDNRRSHAGHNNDSRFLPEWNITEADTSAGLAYFRDSRADTQAAYRLQARESAASLLDGDTFARLDGVDASTDGRITRENLEQFVETNPGGDQSQLAASLLEDWETGAGEWLRDRSDSITLETLANASNLESIESLRLDGIPESLVDHVAESDTLHRIKVEAGGRQMDSTVLLPDNYDPDRQYPVVVGFHSFPGDGDGFGQLTRAEEMRQAGMIVVLPSAASGLTGGQWMSPRPGIRITKDLRDFAPTPVPSFHSYNTHDDIAGVKETIDVVSSMYAVDQGDINFLAHSQGATVALEVAKDLAEEGEIKPSRLFLSAGTMIDSEADASQLAGMDVYRYLGDSDHLMRGGHALMTGTDSNFTDEIREAKSCTTDFVRTISGVSERTDDYETVNRTVSTCADGSKLVEITESEGQHAYPGQPDRYDGGMGGDSNLYDMTADLINQVTGARNLREVG